MRNCIQWGMEGRIKRKKRGKEYLKRKYFEKRVYRGC
jgi:hypothetical protein